MPRAGSRGKKASGRNAVNHGLTAKTPVLFSEEEERLQPLAGTLLAVRPGTEGLPESRFGG